MMTLSDFNYTSKYTEINGNKIHYIEEGQGDPIVFIHGIPTWSYLWRNIIPYLQDDARCIALDLIGCGHSAKPDIQYTINEHIEYFQQFMSFVDSDNATLVMHGWGSVVGFNYAMNHPDKIKGLAFLESHLRVPAQRDRLSLPVQEVLTFLQQDDAKNKILNSNFYVEKVLQSGVLRKLEAEELAQYLLPFEKSGSRQPIWQYLQELPTGDNETLATTIIRDYSEKLSKSEIPKLLLYAFPGFITTIDTVKWAQDTFSHLTIEEIGEALHYAQETEPTAIGEKLRDWYLAL